MFQLEKQFFVFIMVYYFSMFINSTKDNSFNELIKNRQIGQILILKFAHDDGIDLMYHY